MILRPNSSDLANLRFTVDASDLLWCMDISTAPLEGWVYCAVVLWVPWYAVKPA
ncbi:hypothetical protein [Nocardia vinacea]|uniref:hypothetical protein n=1 Tax=Nocardia vinacea TaxID=96468 RepID=UPI0003008A4F|nr:hypothetical protein [Nocardia vinacea]